MPPFIPPKYIVIHHTAISRDYLPEQLNAVNNSHLAQGYPASPYTQENICYHFFVGTDGTLVQIHGLNERGGCTKNGEINDDAIQIVLAGNFEIEKPSKVQRETLGRLVSELQLKYSIANDHIIGHKEASASACPGKYLEQLILSFRAGRP